MNIFYELKLCLIVKFSDFSVSDNVFIPEHQMIISGSVEDKRSFIDLSSL